MATISWRVVVLLSPWHLPSARTHISRIIARMTRKRASPWWQKPGFQHLSHGGHDTSLSHRLHEIYLGRPKFQKELKHVPIWGTGLCPQNRDGNCEPFKAYPFWEHKRVPETGTCFEDFWLGLSRLIRPETTKYSVGHWAKEISKRSPCHTFDFLLNPVLLGMSVFPCKASDSYWTRLLPTLRHPSFNL